MKAFVGTIIGFIFNIIFLALIAGLLCIVPIIHYRLCKRKPEKMMLYTFLLFFLNPFGIIISIVLINTNLSKKRNEVYNNVIHNSNNNNIDNLIIFINKYGCIDTPNAWHQLRGIWYVVNENSNVSTDKKKELKTFLMTKGLFLHKEEGKIMDNYSK